MQRSTHEDYAGFFLWDFDWRKSLTFQGGGREGDYRLQSDKHVTALKFAHALIMNQDSHTAKSLVPDKFLSLRADNNFR